MENPKSSQKSQEKVEPVFTDDPKQQAADPIVENGWQFYAQKEYTQAIGEFRKALEITPDNIDTLYALGLTLEAHGDVDEGVSTFQKVIQAIESAPEMNRTRAMMLTRMAHAHISRMQTGDWHINR